MKPIPAPLPPRPATPAFDRRRRALAPAPAPARRRERALAVLALAALLGACAGQSVLGPEPGLVTGMRMQAHTASDDLLTAGLGEAGLRSATPPAFADPDQPTAAELRRRAVWANWRGIADLAPGGGFGEFYGSFGAVPGREFHALAALPGRRQPHRVMVQLPDAFDVAQRCVVVTASSGSRGIYGAISLAGGWGLPRGCAVAYTDKGAGTGYVDTADGRAVGLDGRAATADAPAEFRAPLHAGGGIAPVAVKHAHSGDNPEADWGRHLQQAAAFALEVLTSQHPEAGPWTFANTRVLAVGVSNGGGAVLQAAALPGAWLDGAVAIAPSALPGEGGRPLYDYGTQAALLMPCALTAPAFDAVALARPGGAPSAAGLARCASLHRIGALSADTPAAQAAQAHAQLRDSGWTDGALEAAALSTAFDLWRAVAVTYASSYARTGPSDMPCGYRLSAVDAAGAARAPTPAERAAWWSDASGIPPGAGVGIVDGQAQGEDPALPGLRCLRALWTQGDGAVTAGIAETRVGLPRSGLPLLVLHGADDGLVPEAFSGGAYARWVQAQGKAVSYWRIANAQHFDAFLGLPALAGRYVPLMPFGYRAMDAMWAHVAQGEALPGSAEIATAPRRVENGALAPLRPANLGTLP
jgi:hydroxybutyrate-dimer hydrolase